MPKFEELEPVEWILSDNDMPPFTHLRKVITTKGEWYMVYKSNMESFLVLTKSGEWKNESKEEQENYKFDDPNTAIKTFEDC